MRAERARLPGAAPVAKAMDYMLNRWPSFARFLGDGRVCMTNNASERALRGLALGRKAWLFAGSDRGGQRAAFFNSLIVTAKLNHVDPQAWLADVLGRIASHPAQRLANQPPRNPARFNQKLLDNVRRAAEEGRGMLIAHRVQLDPTDRQRTAFGRAAGTARFAYNWAAAAQLRRPWKGEQGWIKRACRVVPGVGLAATASSGLRALGVPRCEEVSLRGCPPRGPSSIRICSSPRFGGSGRLMNGGLPTITVDNR